MAKRIKVFKAGCVCQFSMEMRGLQGDVMSLLNSPLQRIVDKDLLGAEAAVMHAVGEAFSFERMRRFARLEFNKNRRAQLRKAKR